MLKPNLFNKMLSSALVLCFSVFSLTVQAEDAEKTEVANSTGTQQKSLELNPPAKMPKIQTIYLQTLQDYAKLQYNLRRRNISLSDRRYTDVDSQPNEMVDQEQVTAVSIDKNTSSEQVN